MNDVKRVMVGVDLSARSRTAAEMAVMLSQRIGADIEFIHVIETDPDRLETRILGLDAERMKQALEEEAKSAIHDLKVSLDCEDAGECVLFGNAAQQITKHCEERQVELLVIGDTGAKSVESRRSLGTTAYRLVERGPDRLLVVKPSYHGKLDRIAAAIDFSPVSDIVLAEAAKLAAITSSELFVIHVYSFAFIGRIGTVSGPAQMTRAMAQLKIANDKRIKAFVEERLPQDISAHADAVAGPESAALEDYLMDKGIDLVVVGTGTSARLFGYPIGSVTHGILNETMSSVLVVRSESERYSFVSHT